MEVPSAVSRAELFWYLSAQEKRWMVRRSVGVRLRLSNRSKLLKSVTGARYVTQGGFSGAQKPTMVGGKSPHQARTRVTSRQLCARDRFSEDPTQC